MSNATLKQKLREIVSSLPDDVTWGGIRRAIYEQRKPHANVHGGTEHG